LEDFYFFIYFFAYRRSISDGSDRTEMAGARLELNGASKSRIMKTMKQFPELEPQVASRILK
jgi:hypothetical protein